MKIIDSGDFFLVEPSEIYAEQIREYRQDFLDSSMDGCGPLRKCEDPITYISECQKYTVRETVPSQLVRSTHFFLTPQKML